MDASKVREAISAVEMLRSDVGADAVIAAECRDWAMLATLAAAGKAIDAVAHRVNRAQGEYERRNTPRPQRW